MYQVPDCDRYRLVCNTVRGCTRGQAIDRMFHGTVCVYKDADDAVRAAANLQKLIETVINNTSSKVVYGLLSVLDQREGLVCWQWVIR